MKGKRSKRKRDLVSQRSKMKRRKLTHTLENHENHSIATPTEEVVAIERDMMEWVELGSIPHPLLRALQDLKFYWPTEIQMRTIPLVAMGDNDIIGAAETVCVQFSTACVLFCVM